MNFSTDKKEQRFNALKKSLNTLVGEYKDTRQLLGDQIQAVIYHDLVWLNSLIEQQFKRYENLKDLEEQFKNELHSAFKDHNVSKKYQSLSDLLQFLEEPSEELKHLRDELREQVEKTQKLREQLMDLLQFASRHNAEMFEGIFKLGNEGAEIYDAKGKKKSKSVSSVAINQKA